MRIGIETNQKPKEIHWLLESKKWLINELDKVKKSLRYNYSEKYNQG